MGKISQLILMVLAITLLQACYSAKVISNEGFHSSNAETGDIVSNIPNYQDSLSTIKGKGKAIVSEPENSQRITLYFASNRDKSRLTFKNRLGIEGGQLLAGTDSLLIYNKIDDYARIIPVEQGAISRVNNLASVNILEIINIPVEAEQVKEVLENEKNYLLTLQTGTKIYVDKKTFLVQQVDQPATSSLPYSRIIYDAYDTIEGFSLPRRITIFSTDKSSRVALLVEALKINPTLESLTINLPDDIKIYRP